MSATTFLLILAAVVIVFVGFVIRSWNALSNVKRVKKREDEEQDQAGDDNGR